MTAEMRHYSEDEQRVALEGLRKDWHRIVTKAGLSAALRAPVFELHRNRNWGEWREQGRILSINARLAIECARGEVLETLRHEIAHQWVSEVARVQNEPAHGATWRRGCRVVGADPRATAMCELEALTREVVDGERRAIERVRKLLALAESDNEHEATLAALRASELMFKHQLESIEAPRPVFNYRTLGAPRRRRPGWVLTVANILAEHFNVETIWLREGDKEWDGDPETPGFLLEITGAPKDVEIAAYVHDFLIDEGARLLQRYRQRTCDSSARGRRRFLEGLYQGFQDKLEVQRRALIARHPTPETAALVRAGDPRRRAFFGSRYPRINTSYGRAQDASDVAFRAGHDRGKTLAIRRPLNESSGGGKLLT